MFYLMDIPAKETFQELAGRYTDMDPPAVKTTVKLLRVGSDLLTGFEKMLGRYGLSQGRFLILVVMNRDPDRAVTPSELAEKIGVTRATMTGLIDGLEKDGLIARRPHARDRRKTFLKLEEKARQLLESILPDYWRRIAGLMKALNNKEKKQLFAFLEKVEAGIPELTRRHSESSAREKSKSSNAHSRKKGSK
jgi:DNA-binding MarR family transcriptional regulator